MLSISTHFKGTFKKLIVHCCDFEENPLQIWESLCGALLSYSVLWPGTTLVSQDS